MAVQSFSFGQVCVTGLLVAGGTLLGVAFGSGQCEESHDGPQPANTGKGMTPVVRTYDHPSLHDGPLARHAFRPADERTSASRWEGLIGALCATPLLAPGQPAGGCS